MSRLEDTAPGFQRLWSDKWFVVPECFIFWLRVWKWGSSFCIFLNLILIIIPDP